MKRNYSSNSSIQLPEVKFQLRPYCKRIWEHGSCANLIAFGALVTSIVAIVYSQSSGPTICKVTIPTDSGNKTISYDDLISIISLRDQYAYIQAQIDNQKLVLNSLNLTIDQQNQYLQSFNKNLTRSPLLFELEPSVNLMQVYVTTQYQTISMLTKTLSLDGPGILIVSLSGSVVPNVPTSGTTLKLRFFLDSDPGLASTTPEPHGDFYVYEGSQWIASIYSQYFYISEKGNHVINAAARTENGRSPGEFTMALTKLTYTFIPTTSMTSQYSL